MKKQITKSMTITEVDESDTLDIQDYLNASSEATQRTRTVAIIMLVSCVITFAAWLNSLPNAWMLTRLNKDDYVSAKIGKPPVKESYKNEKGEYDKTAFDDAKTVYNTKHNNFLQALYRGYVENSLIIKAPFLPLTFDVNDLGLIASFGFLIILACFRFCISREVENLNISFEIAKKQKKEKDFYLLLAMKQVFTVPKTKHIKRNAFLMLVPKLVVCIPFTLVTMIIGLDITTTNSIGDTLDPERTKWLIRVEGLSLLFLGFLTLAVVKRMFKLDDLWANDAIREKSADDEPDKELVVYRIIQFIVYKVDDILKGIIDKIYSLFKRILNKYLT